MPDRSAMLHSSFIVPTLKLNVSAPCLEWSCVDRFQGLSQSAVFMHCEVFKGVSRLGAQRRVRPRQMCCSQFSMRMTRTTGIL